MGTINYMTSDFLTIGLNLNDFDFDDIKRDMIENYDDLPDPSDSEVYDYIYDMEGDMLFEVEHKLRDYDFSVFDVEICPGYYEGFSINIKLDCLYLWDEEEREKAFKEAANIRDLWLWSVYNADCCEVWPGWVTSYKSYEETLKSIDEAYNEMIEEVKKIPVDGEEAATC